MKKLHTILACICTAAILPLLVAVMVGCGKDDKNEHITENNLPNLIGTWEMVNFNEYKAFTYELFVLAEVMDSIVVDGWEHWFFNLDTMIISSSYKMKQYYSQETDEPYSEINHSGSAYYSYQIIGDRIKIIGEDGRSDFLKITPISDDEFIWNYDEKWKYQEFDTTFRFDCRFINTWKPEQLLSLPLRCFYER